MGLYKRGSVWWLALTYSGRQVRRSTETTDKKLAQKILAKVQTEIAEGKWFDRLPGETKTFTELAGFGALPFYLYGTFPTHTDCYFEAMSGFTTTGASVLADIEKQPAGILFWRDLMHWIGGMGIVVLSLAILPALGAGGMQLFKAEVPGPTADKLVPRLRDTAKRLYVVYAVISAAEVILLLSRGMSLFDSLTHMFGTIGTGGFSPKNASVGHYQSAYVDLVISAFMFIAGANFSLLKQDLTSAETGI